MFFASLVASLSLAIGLAIYDITIRTLELSTVTAKSEYAIYAADTGVECALYWDAKYKCTAQSGGGTSCGSAFATSSASVTSDPILCTGQTLSIAIDTTCPTMGTTGCSSPSSATTTFKFNSTVQTFNQGSVRSCVFVEVGKKADASGVVSTSIVSHGYNTCTSGARDRLERVLQVNY